MPGFQTSHKNKTLFVCSVLLSASICATGCSGAEESGGKDPNQKQLNSFLAKYEKTFNPSNYDADLSYLFRVERDHHITAETRSVFTTAVPETLAGYRAQVLFTNNIEIANSAKDTIESLLPEEWCYIVYDAPYYKVRVGNFLERDEASRMVRDLLSLGFKDSWVVPDNIFINLTPKPPVIEIEPDQRFTPP
jgi:hypothetical protein